MKKVVFACFAHPDDEAFGPSGTLYKLAQAGADVHLMLITDGDAGTNSDGHANLGEIRRHEWQQSAKLIGAASTTALGHKDGTLNNHQYLPIAKRLRHYAHSTLHNYDEAVEIMFITSSPNGITGHIDHITASMVTTYIYLKLRDDAAPNWHFNNLKYVCVPETVIPKANTDWLFMPRGCRLDEIDEISDISTVSDKKLAIMKAHHSQRQDMNAVLGMSDDVLQHEYFVYYKD